MKKIAKLLIIVITVALITALFVIGASATEFAGGTGTAEDPYLIASKTHLNNVRNYPSAYFKMTADITLDRSDFLYGGDLYDPATGGAGGWFAIGTPETPFSGTFDGDGHTITGLYVNISASSTSYGGLFGYVSYATIKNLGMVDSEISVTATSGDDDAYAGGIAGRVSSSTITNCYNMGTVSAVGDRAYAGGIAGDANNGTIANCYNTGVVSANSDSYHARACAGGIVGDVVSSTITNCYNTGAVSANSDGLYAYAGGIAGRVSSSTITNCYNTGAVSATSYDDYAYAGGIVGDVGSSTTITNCYNTGAVSATSYDDYAYAGGIAGRASSSGITNCYSTGAVRANSSSASAGGIVGSSSKNITNCYYLDIIYKGVGGGTDTATKLTITQMQTQNSFTGFDFENVWQMCDADTYSIPILRGVTHKEKKENTTEFAGGNGSIFAPYLISTKAHLNNVRNYPYAYFKMTVDIEFTEDDFKSGGTFYNSGKGWIPIGDDTNKFAGVFDGNDHTISGLSASSTSYGGLFGYVSCATIKNLGMVDPEISVTATSGDDSAYAGGIAGRVSSSTITNCYNTGTIITTEGHFTRAGGIVGEADSTTTITNCYNTGIISGSRDAGGIVGDVGSSTITNCYNTGNISGENAGGIAGDTSSSSTITNCYNTGEVSGSYVGGIVGYPYGTVTNCYNTGIISGSRYAGGIVGAAYETVTNCYNTGTISGKYAGGIVGYAYNNTTTNCYYLDNVSKGVGYRTDTATKCTDAELQYQGTFLGFNFTDVWTMSGNQNYPYPELISVPYNRTGSLVSGTALSWNNTDDAVYVLYGSAVTDDAIKAEWLAGTYSGTVCTGKETIVSTTVDGKAMYSQTFGFYEMANGNYKLAIFKPGKYVPKIIEVSVNGSSVDLGQQKLWLYGDVNYDGKVNATDATQILRFFNNKTPNAFTSDFEERKICADVNKDGKINATDATQILRYFNNKTPNAFVNIT